MYVLCYYSGRVVYRLCYYAGRYGVHSHPVYFQNQTMQDITYFNGNTIRLECNTTCKKDCDIRIRYNRSSYLVHDNLYQVPISFEILDSKNHVGKQILTITNASINSNGIYQCVIKVWGGYIVGKEIHLQMTGNVISEVGFCLKNIHAENRNLI